MPEASAAEQAIQAGVNAVKNAAINTATSALNKLGLGKLLKGGDKSKTNAARGQASLQDAYNASLDKDWRVKLSLAPKADYLYKDPSNKLLAPLAVTNGIIFPYTPSVSVTYLANYDSAAVQHSNYKIFQYQNSAIESITIGCDFTCQDVSEAQYLLAVIHFLRSATKMFYGQDQGPPAGTPPPLCYLTGLGAYQFDNHPLVINSFNYQLPTDVDYIVAYNPDSPESPQPPSQGNGASSPSDSRLGGQVAAGGTAPPATGLDQSTQGTGATNVTYVPTKMNIQFTAYPVISRNVISKNFSVKDYANGKLLQGSKNKIGAGVW